MDNPVLHCHSTFLFHHHYHNHHLLHINVFSFPIITLVLSMLCVFSFPTPRIGRNCSPPFNPSYIADGIATRCGLDSPGIETGGARFSAPVHTGPGTHSANCAVGTGSYHGVKRPGRGANHPHVSNSKVANGSKPCPRLPSVPTQAWHSVTFTFNPVNIFLAYFCFFHTNENWTLDNVKFLFQVLTSTFYLISFRNP